MAIPASHPAAGTRTASATSAGVPGTSASPRSTPLRAQRHGDLDRKRATMVISAIMVVGVVFVLILATRVSMTGRPNNPTQTTNDLSANSHFDAKVFIDTTGNGDCQQEVFDNQTGRMTRLRQPCDDTAQDANGIPIPKGTIHRLDAISKSFRDK
jgi:hypothetical protein